MDSFGGVFNCSFLFIWGCSAESNIWVARMAELHRATVNGGVVNVLLGTKNALPENRADHTDQSSFQQSLYLQITIDANDDSQITDSDPPLLPRQAILPAIFANDVGNARTLNGYDWTTVFGTNDIPSSPTYGKRSPKCPARVLLRPC